MKRLAILVALAATLAPLSAMAEEGMWTYDNFPSQAVAQKYGFAPTQDWLDHARLSSFERATGQDPFALPASWLAAKNRLALATPSNFVSTTDIIGGNSGSPVINSKDEAVGLIFDGNIQSLCGAFGFDPSVNRAVAITTHALTEALSKIYGAERIVKERQGN